MRRSLLIYSFTLSILFGFAGRGLITLSEGLIEFWRWNNPENPDLPLWTVFAPTLIRIGFIGPSVLFVLSLLSLKRDFYRDRFLIHGIAITSLLQGLITIFTILAGFMPAIGPIITLPNE